MTAVVSSRTVAAYAAGAGTLPESRAILDSAPLPVLLAAKLRIEDNPRLTPLAKITANLRIDCRIRQLQRSATPATFDLRLASRPVGQWFKESQS